MATAAFETPEAQALPGDPAGRGGRDGAQQALRRLAGDPEEHRLPRRTGRRTGEQRAIAKMGELLGKYRSLQVYMDACVHCGACSDKCHYFLGTGDPKNMPVARQDLMRAVYRRYFTFAGKHFPKLVGAVDMTKDVLDDWYSLLPPVLGVPPLLGVLPLRHRHRRNHHGRARDHGLGRHGPEVLQRDHRQGPPHRQQPRPARPGAGRHAAGPGRRHQGRDRRRRALPARRARAPRCCWSRRRPTSSPSRTSRA